MELIRHLLLLDLVMKVDASDAETILFYSVQPWSMRGGKEPLIVNVQKLAEQHLEKSKKVVEEALQRILTTMN